MSIEDQSSKPRLLSTTKRNEEAHESFERACRALNGTLFALSGAILAGLGQIAGNGALARHPIPEVPVFSLVNAFVSIFSGVAFLFWLYREATHRRIFLTEVDPQWARKGRETIASHEIPKEIKPLIDEEFVLEIIEGGKEGYIADSRRRETQASILLSIQFVTWLFGTGAYAFLMVKILSG